MGHLTLWGVSAIRIADNLFKNHPSMPENAQLEALFAKAHESLKEAMRAAWYGGVEHGTKTERERLIGLIQGEAKAQSKPEPAVREPVPVSPTPEPQASSEYGAIIRPVREALQALGGALDGITAPELAESIRQQHPGIEVNQIRTALKVLAKRGEAVRLERGRYQWAEASKNGAPPASTEGASKTTDEVAASSTDSRDAQKGIFG
jgi:hypothetical protein